jgi:LacI family transcriptional regulator
MGRSTLKEVAAAAGVSVPTASKVLNHRGDIAEETRTRVLAAAEEIGYSARIPPPRNRPRTSVKVILSDLASPYAQGILEGVVHAGARADAEICVTTMDAPRDGAAAPMSRPWFSTVAGDGHRAVIAVTVPVSAAQSRWAAAAQLPLIAVDPESEIAPGSVRVSATNWAGAHEATRHLLEQGHRRIGAIIGVPTSAPGIERVQGYRSALEELGIGFDGELVKGDDFDLEVGYAAARELLERDPRPSAIFAIADVLAVGALQAAHDLGLSVPEDLSLVSFDDTVLARTSIPRLTAVHPPLFAMGQVAVERALALVRDPEAFAHPFQLVTSLIVRDSTAPPGSGSASGGPD